MKMNNGQNSIYANIGLKWAIQILQDFRICTYLVHMRLRACVSCTVAGTQYTTHRRRNQGGTGGMCPPKFHKLLYKLLTTLCVVINCAPPQSKSLSYTTATHLLCTLQGDQTGRCRWVWRIAWSPGGRAPVIQTCTKGDRGRQAGGSTIPATQAGSDAVPAGKETPEGTCLADASGRSGGRRVPAGGG